MEEINSINYIKAFAIITVILTHFWLPKELDRRLFWTIYNCLGVPLFMIVTGHNYMSSFHKINKNIFEKIKLKQFINRKLVRIITPYIYIHI